MGPGIPGDRGRLVSAAAIAAEAARHPLYVGERRPDRGIEFVEPEVGGDEAEAAVEADRGTDEDAVHIDDIGLQHGGAPSGCPGHRAIRPAVMSEYSYVWDREL